MRIILDYSARLLNITSLYSVLSKRVLELENFNMDQDSFVATIIQNISDFQKILKNWREKLQLQIILDYSDRLLFNTFSYSVLSKQLHKWENFNMDQDSLVATIIQYISDFPKILKNWREKLQLRIILNYSESLLLIIS